MKKSKKSKITQKQKQKTNINININSNNKRAKKSNSKSSNKIQPNPQPTIIQMYSTPPSFQGSLTPNNYGVGRTRQTEGGQTRLENVEDNRIQEEIKNVYDNNRVENLIKLREAQLKQSKSSLVVDDSISDVSNNNQFNGSLQESKLGSQKVFRNPIIDPSIDNMTLPSEKDNDLIFERLLKNEDSKLRNTLKKINRTSIKDEIQEPRAIAPFRNVKASESGNITNNTIGNKSVFNEITNNSLESNMRSNEDTSIQDKDKSRSRPLDTRANNYDGNKKTKKNDSLLISDREFDKSRKARDKEIEQKKKDEKTKAIAAKKEAERKEKEEKERMKKEQKDMQQEDNKPKRSTKKVVKKN
jgi:hypothetical protein